MIIDKKKKKIGMWMYELKWIDPLQIISLVKRQLDNIKSNLEL